MPGKFSRRHPAPLSRKFHCRFKRLSSLSGSIRIETQRGEMTMNREQEQELTLMYLQLLLRTPNAHLVPMHEIQELLEAINGRDEPGLNPERCAA